LDGYGAGVTDARAALAQMLRCGGRADRPIYFSADFDATPQQQVPIDAYLDGAASVLGRSNVGIYGGYWPVSRALDAGTATWAWQTVAWSGGRVDPRIAIYQNGEQVIVDGVECDVNQTDRIDFGQWDVETEEPDLTPEQDAALHDIQIQLRGPGLNGWPQLGTDAQGRNRTVVDGLAAALTRIDELRTEISELEATTAELKEELARVAGKGHWPFPFSLVEGPATAFADQLAKLEQLLPDVPLPGWGTGPNGYSGDKAANGSASASAVPKAVSDS
ncbi:glycoside hydrolase domain-containing protein, partial [Nocardia sp. NPDC059764]|uniref:glycoside hydrolase domain-containing protein n=1 Tax=Nocardia sp. NPDC059764 TaxID=3346939 RepID=UPI00364FC8BE